MFDDDIRFEASVNKCGFHVVGKSFYMANGGKLELMQYDNCRTEPILK